MPTHTSAVLLDSARAVWPEPACVGLTRDVRPAGKAAQDYVVLPGLRSPKWLLPADEPAAAAALASHETSAVRQLAVRLLTWAHRSGMTRRLPMGRVRVQMGDAQDTESLVTLLSSMLDEQVAVAIRLGSWGHARSLVVRVFGSDGGTRAFAKVGLDALGRAAVRAERDGLSRVTELGTTGIVHPHVLDHADWQGLEVLLISPVDDSDTRERRGEVPLEAMRELAGAGGLGDGTLSESGWFTSIGRRICEVDDRDRRARLESALRALDASCGDLRFALGCWHGDWTPWNMGWDGRRVTLWDWEHFAEAVPFGFDHVHFLAQKLRVSTGTGQEAERSWLAQAGELLGGPLGLPPRHRDALVVAYLLEVNVRFVLDRQHTSQRDTPRMGWGLELLGSEAGRLGGQR